MSDTIPQTAWLAEEIKLAEEYLARHEADDDPVHLAAIGARQRELDVLRRQLARLESPTQELDIKLAGGQVRGHDAPIDLVRQVMQRYAEIATEFDAEALVSPATPGSHVIHVVGPTQGQLAVPGADTFAEAAAALMELSPDAMPRGAVLSEHARTRAEEFTPKTLIAVRELMNTLSSFGVSADLDLVSPTRTAHVSFRRDVAQELTRVLADLQNESEILTVVGVLRGFMEFGLTFEIEGDQLYKGRVPAALREAAEGIRIGADVAARIEKITSTRPSGDERVRYRLRSIVLASEPGGTVRDGNR